jgi:hypothetical protein
VTAIDPEENPSVIAESEENLDVTNDLAESPAGTTDPVDSPGVTAVGADGTAERALARPRGDDPDARVELLAPDELESMVNRWRDIQANFVDEPRQAVKDADTLVADLMQRLTEMFTSERERLEARWSSGDSVSTEDLRQGLQRYRSFFERLLAA